VNAIFSENRLKLGLFGTNGGATLSRVPEVWRPNWEGIVETAVLADRAGFEAQLAYARWKGFVPDRPEQGPSVVMDPFTWAAGVSQVTSYSTVIATTHAPTMHPITCAKQTATIDQMSGGRFALNIVGGWNKAELDMFGTPLKEHDLRYDELDEWLEVVERLWDGADEFDFEGDFYRIVKGISRPQPVQRPRPPILNAGGSARGRQFAVEHADVCFVIPKVGDLQGVRAQVDSYKDAARELGREVQVWTYCAVSQRDSRAAAEDYFAYFAEEMADDELIDAWSANLLAQTGIVDPAEIREYRRRFAAGSGGPVLVGTHVDIADQMQELSELGVDGLLLTWPDFVDGVRRVVAPEGLMSELERRGLRQPFPTA
jgi:dimethylsulfone monooxygenase